MDRFPIKTISDGHKNFKIFGIAVDKRQGMILGGTVLGYWALYQHVIVTTFKTTTPQAIVAFVPLLLLALAFAFVKLDGRHLSFWAQKKTQNKLRPKVLKWKRRGPDHASAAPAGPGRKKGRKRRGKKKPNPKPVRDSVQEALPAEQIFWEMIRLKDGTYVMVLEVKPVSLSLVGLDEQQRIWAAAAGLYNRIDFPMIELARAVEGNVNTYAKSFKKRVLEEVSPHEQRLADFAREHLAFLKKLVPLYNVYDRRGYVVLPYKPENPDTKSRHKTSFFGRLLVAFGLKPDVKDATRLQKAAEDAYGVLWGRAEVVTDAFSRMGARLKLLSGEDLLMFLKGQVSGEDDGTKPSLFDQITLEVGAYGRIAPAKLKRMVDAQEKVRRKSKKTRGYAAPPAVGVGDLTLPDKIAPDAVRVHADFVRVGHRYHATLYVYDYPPDIGFGDLRSVLNIPGRVKFVKYVSPVPQDKAVHVLGGHVAELTAAEITARDGDVITDRKRRTALQSADAAMLQLQNGQQKLFDTTFIVHCEADDEEELKSLVRRVKTTLAALRVDAKLAREEAWEGFVTALPLAKNLLEPKYANKGLLTNPLACLFVHGSYQVDHEDGVLMGIDPYTGGLVVLDTRELVNPHMVILGTSGGGKTVTVKALSTRSRMRGHRVVVIDPEGNSGYGRVARRIDGEYVVFGVGSESKFNPCDLSDNYMNLNLLASASEEDDPEEAIQRARGAALDGKILMLTRLVSLMISGDEGKGGLGPEEWGPVERAWTETYADAGITADPETHKYTPPIMHDFFKKLGQLAQEPEYAVLKSVRARLYSWEYGALRTIFDSQTNVNLDNRYLVLQIAGVKGREKASLMYALLDFLNGRLSDPREPSDCYIDEFWSLLKFEMAADFVEEMFRSGRARNNAMNAITQEINEFLRSEPGKVIMSIAASQLLLKQKKKTAEILDQFADLSPEQKRQLTNSQKGEGYLLVEDNRVPLYVVCSEAEMRLFNTDQKREREYERIEKATLAEEKRTAALEAGAPVAPAGSTPVANVIKKLAAHGQAREILSEDEDHVPEPGDYETVLVGAHTENGHSTNGYHANGNSPKNGPSGGPYGSRDGGTGDHPPDATPEHPNFPDEPAGPPAEGPPYLGVAVPEALLGQAAVHAVVGEGSTTVAYNLAGLAATAAREGGGRRVLFVDAEGAMTRNVFDSFGLTRPDGLLAPPETEGDVDAAEEPVSYVLTDPNTTLSIVACPEDTALSPIPLVEQARSGYDLVIVACGSGAGITPYAEGWVAAAAGPGSLVAASSSAGGLLEAARSGEAAAVDKVAILAPLGLLDGEEEDQFAAGRNVAWLPPEEDPAIVEARESRGSFATLGDWQVGRIFRELLLEMITRAREDGQRPL